MKYIDLVSILKVIIYQADIGIQIYKISIRYRWGINLI